MDASGDDWAPDASLQTLGARATLLHEIRAFFAARGVMEADVPALSAAAAQEPQVLSIACEVAGDARYLHFSPEFGLKRLLAAGAGPVYYLGHVFRDGEVGRWHNPEFCMLEWYRPGWDAERLLEEIEALLTRLRLPGCRRLDFGAAFRAAIGVNAHTGSVAALRQAASERGLAPASTPNDHASGARAFWLDALVGLVLAPSLGQDSPCILFDWPAQMAGLTRLRPGSPPVAERFELYWRGVELGNGGAECTDPAQVAASFAADNAARRAAGAAVPAQDHRLLAALRHGLPACAGVAIGVDRLLALSLGLDGIEPVLPFSHLRA
ncbi:MAG: EF-P lysine aminoacylase GenX [Salinisphaera sp.]|nr:EF-P lysine aminoacylase GenX [Salinisphaera sp.]